MPAVKSALSACHSGRPISVYPRSAVMSESATADLGAKRGSPESITTAWDYGFRARRLRRRPGMTAERGAPRNDSGGTPTGHDGTFSSARAENALSTQPHSAGMNPHADHPPRRHRPAARSARRHRFAGAQPAAATAQVTFVLVNDIYLMSDTMMPDGKRRGGFARLAAVVKAERARADAAGGRRSSPMPAIRSRPR